MSSYDDADKARAANLYIHGGYSYGDLEDEEGLPSSRSTFSRWNERGEGIEGDKTWDEMIELMEQEVSAMQERESFEEKRAKVDTISETIVPRLTTAIRLLEEQLAEEGDAAPSYAKLAKMYDQLGSYMRNEHVGEIQERLQKLAQTIGRVIGEHVSDSTTVRQIRANVEGEFNDAAQDIEEMLGVE
jgi:transposase-like protein